MRRPSLDGLRALAVLAVMGYHFSFGHYPGGFLGVELFFVLSGYLITSLLVAEYESTSTISLRRFYMRRVLRLAPALLLATILANVIMIAIPGPLITPSVGIAQADLSVLVYIANWVQVPEPGDIGALSHAWSLAVEEQFYLLWPAALVFLVLKTRQPPRWTLVAASVAAVVTAVALLLSRGPAGLYFASSTHAVALLLGCAAALWPRAQGIAILPVAATGGLVLLVMSFVVSETSPLMYVGGFVLAALAGTVLVTHCATATASRLVIFLSYGPLTAVGRISYGLYLFHFPIFLMAQHFVLPHSHLWLALLMAGSFAATFVVAAASYALIEKPALRLKDRWRSVPPRLAAVPEPN